MNYIQSNKHFVYSKCINKLVLSANDDESIIIYDGVNTTAYSHYRVII